MSSKSILQKIISEHLPHHSTVNFVWDGDLQGISNKRKPQNPFSNYLDDLPEVEIYGELQDFDIDTTLDFNSSINIPFFNTEDNKFNADFLADLNELFSTDLTPISERIKRVDKFINKYKKFSKPK